MIATSARISGIDPERQAYYDYLNTIFREIWDYLKIQDGSVNPQKLELMFERTVSPYVYWQKESQQQVGALSEEDKKKFLEAVEKKYNLKHENGKYFKTKPLKDTEFNQLREDMKQVGYRYESKERAFVRDVR